MEELSTEFADWIFDQRIAWPKGNVEEIGLSIGNCIPVTFEAYCKIFHPFEETPDLPDALAPLENFDFYKREEAYESKSWRFVTWQYVFEKFSLVFHKEASTHTLARKFEAIGYPKNLMFPWEGYLCREKFIQLVDILKIQTKTDEAFIYQMVPNTIWKNDKAEDLVKCTFKEILQYFNFDFIGNLFAGDKSWVVFTDTDLKFTIVGGSEQLIQAILESDLEALLCQHSTRIDAYSDKINEEKLFPKTDSIKSKIKWWHK